jgi:hypothetical protein
MRVYRRISILTDSEEPPVIWKYRVRVFCRKRAADYPHRLKLVAG